MRLSALAFVTLMMGLNSGDSGCEGPCENRYIPNGPLPEATQSGRGTMGCLVEGVPYLPGYASWYLTRDYYAIAEHRTGRGELALMMGAEDCADRFQAVEIYVTLDSLRVGTYPLARNRRLSPTSSTYVENASVNPRDLKIPYATTHSSVGELVITHLDRNQRIVSGTFWFNAWRGFSPTGQTGPDSVRVRHGRFDLVYEVAGY